MSRAGGDILREIGAGTVRLALAVALAVLAAAGVRAEPVAVRSGEHPGFTRLVLDFATLPDWTMVEDGTARQFIFDGPPVRFEAGSVFARIGRQRIRGLRAGMNRLDLDLGCACAVTAAALPGGRLVIDVSDRPSGSPDARARPEPAVTGFARPAVLDESLEADGGDGGAGQGTPLAEGVDPPALAGSADAPGDGFLVSPGGPVGLVRDSFTPDARPPDASGAARPEPTSPDPAPHGAGRAALTADRAEAPQAVANPPEPFTLPSELVWPLDPFAGNDRRDTATAALAEALERAARQGLVDSPEATAPANAAAVVAGPPDSTPLPLPLGGEPGLRVTTSIDRDLAAIARRLQDNAGSGCLAGFDLDVAGWGDDSDLVGGLTARRSGLVGEFDLPDPDATMALVRHYVYLSFGAEARAVLAAFLPANDEAAVLGFLADIADGRTRPEGDPAATLVACPGPAALWGLLAVETLPEGTQVAKAEVTGAFSDLPLHLRRHYGPVLVRRLLALGDRDTARTVWSAIDRARGDHGEAFALVSGDLAMAEGDAAEAEARFASLEGASPAMAPLAVIRLIRSQLARGTAPDAGLVETAAALGFENRGTALARDLKIVELEARTALGDWDRVFEELPRARFDGALTGEDETALLAALCIAMAERAETADFLPRAFEAQGRLATDESGDGARRALADRFLDLGLADRAGALIDTVAAPAPEDRLRHARAALLKHRFDAAEALLADETSQEAARLRAEALLGLGRPVEAARSFDEAGAPDEAALAAARGGLWAESPETLRETAAPLLAEPKDLSPEMTPLALNRALIDDADRLRADISALLSATVAVDTGGGG